LHLPVVGDDLAVHNRLQVVAAGCAREHCQEPAHNRTVGSRVRYSLASICAAAEEIMFPIWYATPGNVARNAGGAISVRWMGIYRRPVSARVKSCRVDKGCQEPQGKTASHKGICYGQGKRRAMFPR
jgi:hypothetical protein